MTINIAGRDYSTVPECDYGVRTKNCRSPKTELKYFLKSPEFQSYCNLPENGVHDGSIIWVVRGSYMIPMYGTFGEVVSDFSIVPCNEKQYLYRTKRFVNKPSRHEEEIAFSQAYLVRRNSEGCWIPQLLWENDQWLRRGTVLAAVKEICATRGYRTAGRLDVYRVQYNNINTLAWLNVVIDSQGEARELICLLDSGKVEDLPVDAVGLEKAKIGYIRTKFNIFRYDGVDIERDHPSR